jgi:hypothetical protein
MKKGLKNPHSRINPAVVLLIVLPGYIVKFLPTQSEWCKTCAMMGLIIGTPNVQPRFAAV